MSEEMLRAHKISKSFPRERTSFKVLQDVSLTIKKGEVVCLLGASGSGKSTLLYCLSGLEGIDKGEIFFQQQLISDSQKKQMLARRRIGMVFQQFNLFPHLNVKGNLTLALRHVHGYNRQQAEDRAREVLQQVGMLDRLDAAVHELSGGQQQRIAIARALAIDPAVIFFDEPTSALDPELVSEVLQVIQQLADQGRTLLLITHELAFARRAATRVLFMDEGLLLEDSEIAAFFSQPQHPRAQLFIQNYF